MDTEEDATLAGIAAFCATVEHGNFTLAAKALRVAPQSVSRAVAQLERRLGVVLFRRTTRAVVATQSAHTYYASCKSALAQLHESAAELKRGQAHHRDTLRISIGTPFAHHVLIPLLPEFVKRHPNLRLELHVSNQNIDFINDDFDIAIRLGAARPDNFVVRNLGSFALGCFASPSYIRQRGQPHSPNELEQHQCIGFALPRTGKILPWSFLAPHGDLPIAPSFVVMDDVLATLSMARAGLGIVQTYDFAAAGDIKRGALVEVLQNVKGKGRTFQALYPAASKPHPLVTALVSHLRTQLPLIAV